MSTKKRYGAYGRAITSPALLSSSVGWSRPDPSSQIDRLLAESHEYAVPTTTTSSSRPPSDPKQKSRAERLRHRISERRTNTYMIPPQRDAAIDALMNKYLNKSKENITTTTSTSSSSSPVRESARAAELLSRRKSGSRDESPTIDSLIKRYGNSTSSHRIKDATISRRESLEKENENMMMPRSLDNKSCNEARLSGSEVRIKWEVASEVKPTSTVKRFSVTIDPNRMPVGSSGSRSGRLARISQSNIRPFGSSGGVSASNIYGPVVGSDQCDMPISSLLCNTGYFVKCMRHAIRRNNGTHPMTGAEPASPTKKEPKHRFEITKKLGSGTYGKVSLAYDHKFDREVAVKLIKKSAIENKADLVRIRREIRIMSALNHPNIIQIYEVFENKDKIILVMEYSSGGELYDYVSRCGSLPEAEARRIFRQITSAVLYCHKHKVAHRDLKLENILMDQNNNAKIADFGLSNYFSDKVLLTTFCGSPLYASPEIINGTPYKGPEVDCWSLGILLYTLVYGSMPFDGRDFNRMVRQIKRGAYYEPETPSTASMLIRNMLRVNPERRATIFDIASHWWLNLEENMPVIQELPENQIIDHTPLTEREETMVVQDLADEQDVFMEFGHLSNETRKKIEDFRRRRKEAEEYNENSPVKPPKARKTDEKEEMAVAEKSLRGVKEPEKPKGAASSADTNDPLERLRQIENRLGQSKRDAAARHETIVKPREEPVTVMLKQGAMKQKSPEQQPEDPKQKAPSFVPVKEKPATSGQSNLLQETSAAESQRHRTRAHMSASAYRIETDSLNMLMNQVLEQMDRGAVNLNIIAKIKAHPLYDTRPMVKELLESIIAAQPEPVQKQTSKIINKQQSQTFSTTTSTTTPTSRQNTLTRPKREEKRTPTEEEEEEIPAVPSPPGAVIQQQQQQQQKRKMKERPWHSVEVGFDPDEEDPADRMQESMASNATEVTVQDTSFDDSDEDEAGGKQKTPIPETPKIAITKTTVEEEEEESEDEEEYSDSEMEDLADEVEKKAPEESKKIEIEITTPAVPDAPGATSLEANPPPDPSSSPQFLDAFDRGLIKRQSKGKYQHCIIMNYGRGVSTECESPTQQRKFFGGPQPSAELSPFLFETAKEILQSYPNNKLDARNIDVELRRKLRMEKVKADLLKQPKEGDKPRNSYVGSVPPRSPPPVLVKSDGEELDDEEEDEEIEEEEDEEEIEEDEESEEGSVFETFKPRKPVIAGIRTGGVTTATITSANQNKPQYQVTSPTTSTVIHIPEKAPDASAKYLVSAAELRMKSNDSKKDDSSAVAAAIAASDRRISQTNLLFRPNAYQASDLQRRINANSDIPSKPATTTTTTTEGKDTWESASAYIRRKTRERRLRNRTIGTAEEALRALERPSIEPYEDRAFSPLSTDPFYSHHTSSANPTSYIRPRYHDDSYRSHHHDFRAHSPSKYTAAVNRDDRGKSTSYDPYESSTRPSYDRTNYITSSNASPSYTRKIDHEPLNSWANDRKFEVYKTRAERDAERNTSYHTAPTSSYRPTAYYSDRPVTTGLRRPEETYSNYGRSTTPSNDHYAISSAIADNQASSIQNRFRPTARRVSSAMTDADRRSYHRSRSMDRNKIDYDYGTSILNRLTTPDHNDYTYVNYHDSAVNRADRGVTFEKDGHPRSILKNKQSADAEPRGETTTSSSSYEPTGVRSVFERLRRHLSMEKSVSPQRQVSSVGPHGRNVGDSTALDANQKKKRSLLSFNRRKTSEVRLGPDGKLITSSNGYDDARDFKRPSSPIDRIKSLFRKNDTTSGTADYYTSTPSSSSRAYTSTTPTSTRDPYVAQYRKYPGSASTSASRDPSAALNRYSYTPGLSDQRRHWYDDPNIY